MLILFFLIAFGSQLQAQNDPNFTITWEGCELMTDKSSYFVSFNIYYVPGPGQVYPNLQTFDEGHNQSHPVSISFWDCDQSPGKEYYVIYVSVVLKDEDGIPYCSGTEFFGPMQCSELYEGNTYNVIMD